MDTTKSTFKPPHHATLRKKLLRQEEVLDSHPMKLRACKVQEDKLRKVQERKLMVFIDFPIKALGSKNM